MVLQIASYGTPALRTPATPIAHISDEVLALERNMWDTLGNARGSGLAAPQVNRSIRMFVMDSLTTWLEATEQTREALFPEAGIKQTFINPVILEKSPETWLDEEGCLSIPGVSAAVSRPWKITIEYQTPFDPGKVVKTYSGLTARIIQHELDHLDGILYIDYLSAVKKRLIQNKLNKISRGHSPAEYPTRVYPAP